MKKLILAIILMSLSINAHAELAGPLGTNIGKQQQESKQRQMQQDVQEMRYLLERQEMREQQRESDRLLYDMLND